MAQNTEKGYLPHGWIVRVSSKFPDRIYYFNTFTGNSTWECPELVPNPNIKENTVSNTLLKTPAENKSSERQKPQKHHTPDGYPPHQNANHSKKRTLETDNLKNIHAPKKDSTGSKKTLQENPAKKRHLETDEHSSVKNSKIPTAIVTPVVVGQDKITPTPTTSQSLPKKKKAKKKGNKTKLKDSLNVATSAVQEPAKDVPVKHNGPKQPTAQKSNVKRALPSTSHSLSAQETAKALLPTPDTAKKLKTLNTISPLLRECAQNQPSAPTPASLPTNSHLSTPTYIRYEAANHTNSGRTLDSRTLFKTPTSLPVQIKSVPATDTSWDDIEMLDVSEDLTDIEEEAPKQDSNELKSFNLVLDTNMLIHDLSHIKELRETPLQGCGPPHFFIPWVVFQELDGLKSNNNEAGKLAQNAIRYLHKILKSKDPRFHGQSGEEAHNCKREYHDSNDDKMIDLCLSLKEKTVSEKIILMTNDKNLANKAMTYNIIVHDWSSLLKNIKPDIPIQASPSKKEKSERKGSNDTIPAIIAKEKNKLVNERNRYHKEIDLLMAEARQLLKDTLDLFLVEEMGKAYGNIWERFQIDRRLLREILAAYIKYWPSVFSLVFNNVVKKKFDFLHQKALSDEGFNGTLEECLVTLHAIEDIFRAIVKLRPHMTSNISRLQSLLENYSQICSYYNNVDSSISTIEDALKMSLDEYVLSIFNHNWTVVNEMCGMIMDFCGVQHSFVYAKPEMIPPESEYRRVIADLYPSLIQLKSLMKNVITHVKNSTPSQNTFKKFVKALSVLIPSLKIKYDMPDLTHFSGKAMERFCRNPENRQKIEYGFSQLEMFCIKLNEAIQAMIPKAKAL